MGAAAGAPRADASAAWRGGSTEGRARRGAWAGAGGGAAALFGELVVGPHHVVAAVLAQVVLVRAVLPELVVQLLGVDGADLLLLRLRHLRPHVLPQIGRVEDVPAVGVHRAALVALERLAVLQPLVQRELGARVLERLWRGQVGLEHVARGVLVRDERLEERELRQGALDHDAQRAAARAARRLPLQPPQDVLLPADDRLRLGRRRHGCPGASPGGGLRRETCEAATERVGGVRAGG